MTQRLALGIDIGGTNTSYGLVDEKGVVVVKDKMPTTGHGSVHDYINVLSARIEDMSQGHAGNIIGIGVGAPNANYYTGEIIFAPNLPWQGVIPLAQLLGNATGLKVTITNDANAAALGEMLYGAARGMQDFLMLTLGTGVGSGFIANGQLIYGHDGLAGELGHVIAVRDGRKCNCGRYGCLERYCSATGIVITAESWLQERNDESVLREYAGYITSKHIHDAALQGDTLALEIYDYTARILGQTLADAVAITSPAAIIFFGGLAKSGDLILKPTGKYMEKNLLMVFKNKVQLLQSELPDADAAILGASALAW